MNLIYQTKNLGVKNIFYYHKFGLKKLGIQDETELSHIMNVSIGSIQMHIRQYIGIENKYGKTDLAGLGKEGKIMWKIFSEYDNSSEEEIREDVLDILYSLKKRGQNNKYFRLADKERTKAEIKAENLKLKAELETIIKNYIFEEGEIVTLHNAKSPSDPFEIRITKGGKSPYYNRFDRNTEFEFGPLNNKIFDIIYPHKLDKKYFNIKIDLI